MFENGKPKRGIVGEDGELKQPIPKELTHKQALEFLAEAARSDDPEAMKLHKSLGDKSVEIFLLTKELKKLQQYLFRREVKLFFTPENGCGELISNLIIASISFAVVDALLFLILNEQINSVNVDRFTYSLIASGVLPIVIWFNLVGIGSKEFDETTVKNMLGDLNREHDDWESKIESALDELGKDEVRLFHLLSEELHQLTGKVKNPRGFFLKLGKSVYLQRIEEERIAKQEAERIKGKEIERRLKEAEQEAEEVRIREEEKERDKIYLEVTGKKRRDN